MTDNYLQIMLESLEKKLEVLDEVYEINKRQLEASTKKPFDVEAYDAIMDEKGRLIDELNRLDDGFTSTYELVREEVQYQPLKQTGIGKKYRRIPNNTKKKFCICRIWCVRPLTKVFR